MEELPFTEKQIGKFLYLREFDHNVDSEELVWHQDREDREIKVLKSSGWLLQLDNQIPVFLEEGKTYHVKAYVWHRLIKGKQNLLLEIKKNELRG